MDAGTKNEMCGAQVHSFCAENEDGNGIFTVYPVLPGVTFFKEEIHASSFFYRAQDLHPAGQEGFLCRYCYAGRAEFQNGDHMGVGDFSLRAVCGGENICYPFGQYSGMRILVDPTVAQPQLTQIAMVLGTGEIDLAGVANALCTRDGGFTLCANPNITHIFDALYNVSDTLLARYLPLKTIELFLFLATRETCVPVRSDRYFHAAQLAKIKRLRDFITEHMDTHYAQTDLSARFEIALTAMKDCFKAVYGIPMHRYLHEYRLQAAALLLRESDEPIGDIAAKIGYESPARFSAAFKMRFTTTPSAYRCGQR
jgi:AraC-like DNA-binding protein